MSHIKYQTRALIIDSFNVGEADKRILIFTEEFGMILAFAKSLRELKSKLRYSLQKMSFSEIDLVRGKTGWRITNAKELKNFSKEFQGLSHNERTFFHIISLLKRLIQGEERNTYLFDIIIKAGEFLSSDKEEKQGNLIETLTVLRMMDSLGYIKTPSSLSEILGETEISQKVLLKVLPLKSQAITEINQALEDSHL